MMHAGAEDATSGHRLLVDLFYGGLFGTIAKTATAPLDRVKTLLQTQEANPAVVRGVVPQYSGAWNCITRVTAEQGVTALWRGNAANCLRYAPQQGSALAFNDAIRSALPTYHAKTQYFSWLLSSLLYGGLAGAVSCTLCYPLDYAHTCLAAEMGGHGRPRFSGIMDCITTTVRSQGILGLYTGWIPTVTSAFLFYAAVFTTFERVLLLNPYPLVQRTLGGEIKPPADEPPASLHLRAVISTLACACIARTIPVTIAYPFDTQRRRMMLWADTTRADRMYPTLYHTCTRMLREGRGVREMYTAVNLELFRSCAVLTVLAACDTAVGW